MFHFTTRGWIAGAHETDLTVPDGHYVVRLHPTPVAVGQGATPVFRPLSDSTRILAQRIEDEGALNAWTVADIGCGTGILGLWALANGAVSVQMLDISPAAVSLAIQNVVLNGREAQAKVVEGTYPDQPVDIAIANVDTDFYETLAASWESARTAWATRVWTLDQIEGTVIEWA